MKYENLFKPLRVGNLILKNRIVAAPITSYGYEPSPADNLEKIAEKARGGAGLVILGSVAVNDEESVIYYDASSLMGEKRNLYLEELQAIHQYGAKASVEILHCGLFADCRRTKVNPVGPCTIEKSPGDFQGYEGIEPNIKADKKLVIGMDENRMKQVCEDYARTAREAKRMGFDMVMLHFAHGWLPAQFMSPFFNHRTDQYGGSFENRIRFPMMILDAVREAVGPDYPLDMRIGAREYVENGLELEEVVEFIRRAEPKLNMVHVSSGLDKLVGATSYIESPSIQPHQINVEFAEAVKAAVNIPVVTVGGITMPDEAEQILKEGKADAIALGRALVADPDWPKKAVREDSESITPCLRCVSCYGVATEGMTVGCAVNPLYGRKLRVQNEDRPIEKKKRVVVVGGGPAGMRAALAAEERGHEVILLEKADKLGGLLKISDQDNVKIDMRNYKNNLIAQVERSGITVKLSCEADPETVRKLEPEELIVAVGSEPRKLKVPGADRENVMDVVEAHERKLGENVVIIGGGPSGCELALALLKEKHKVTIIEMTDKLAAAGNVLYRGALKELFAKEDNLTVLLETGCLEITDTGVLTEDKEGRRRELPADDIVYSVGMVPKRELAESFYDLVYDVKMIGDCMGARRINEASYEGYFAGHNL